MSIYHRPVNYNNDSLPFGFSFLFFSVLLTRPCCPATYHTVQADLELEAILCPAFLAWSYRPSLLCCPYFLNIFISVWVSMHVMAGVWRSEGSLWDLVLSFHHLGSGTQTQWICQVWHQVFFHINLTVTPTSVLQCLWLNPGPHDTRHVFCHRTTFPALYHIFVFF